MRIPRTDDAAYFLSQHAANMYEQTWLRYPAYDWPPRDSPDRRGRLCCPGVPRGPGKELCRLDNVSSIRLYRNNDNCDDDSGGDVDDTVVADHLSWPVVSPS